MPFARCDCGAQPAAIRPRRGEIMRHSRAARRSGRTHDADRTTARNMNTTSPNPVPANLPASSKKSMTLLKMLALIGAGGLAVSLAIRYFLL